jgi:hypothetical protein
MGTKPYRRQVRWGGSFDVSAATYDHAPELGVRPNPTEASVVEHPREASSTIARENERHDWPEGASFEVTFAAIPTSRSPSNKPKT